MVSMTRVVGHCGKSHGEIKSPSVWLSTNSSQYSPQMERGPAGQVRAEQAAPVSTRNSVLPATSRVTQGSAGVMKMDQEGSISRQALRTHQSVCGLINLLIQLIHKELGLAGVTPWVSPRRALKTSPCVPLSDRSTLVKAQVASWGSAQLSQSFKVPSRLCVLSVTSLSTRKYLERTGTKQKIKCDMSF